MLSDDGRFLGHEAVDERLVLPASGDKRVLEAASPVNGAGRMRAPVLIGHGAENPRFHVKHANAMIDAPRDADRVVASLLCPAATDKFLDDRDHDHDHGPIGETYVHPEPKVSRNHPCPCGSGKKYKKCHDPNG